MKRYFQKEVRNFVVATMILTPIQKLRVSPEDDIELRRVKLTNRTRTNRIIDITSYAEVVMAPNESDLTHPAFSNLFVQTEIIDHRRGNSLYPAAQIN